MTEHAADPSLSHVPGAPAGRAREAALGKATGRGAAWLIFGQVALKFATSVAQVFLGWLLTDEDFGLFAAAASVGGFLMIFRDGGANALVVQRGAKEYPAVAGPLFWMGFWITTLSGLLVAALAYPMEAWLDKKGLAPLLLVIALSAPLNAPALQLQSKLKLDLRFETLSRIGLASGVLRQVLTVVLAFMGFGAMSLAIPYVACAVYEGVASARAVRNPLWRRSADLRAWPALLAQGKWAILGITCNLMLDMGPYLVLAAMVSKSIAGVFYFAFQMTAQLGIILGFAVHQVLFPIFARLNDEPKRQADAIVRSVHALMMIGSISCVGFGVLIDPLERLIWHEKWRPAVLPVMILGAFFPWRITFGLTTALFQGQGRFKRVAYLTGFEGLGLMIATAVAAEVNPTPTAIALATGLWLLIARLAISMYMLRRSGASWGRSLEALMPSWFLACVAGLAALAIDRAVGAGPRVTHALLPLVDQVFASASPRTVTTIAESAGELVRVAILGASCAAIFALGARSFLRHHVQDLLGVAPARVRGMAARLIRVRPHE